MATLCLCTSPPLPLDTNHLLVRSERLHSRISSTLSLPTQLRNCRTVFNSGGRYGRKLSLVHAAAAVDDGRGDDGGADESNKGRQLWRTELLSNEFESLDDEVRQSATLERDIERLTKKEEVARLLSRAADGSRQDQALDQGGRGGVVRDIVDKVLVADFFFILFILGWLVAGLVERAALESTSLIDSWLPLWPSVFQPALGVFMAGAIVSALSKKKE